MTNILQINVKMYISMHVKVIKIIGCKYIIIIIIHRQIKKNIPNQTFLPFILWKLTFDCK